MTREEAKKLNESPVWQAWLKGEDVDEMVLGGWSTVGLNIDAWRLIAHPAAFRIKPKPLEMWVNRYEGEDCSYAYLDKSMADRRANKDRTRCVHMREVVE